MATRYANGIRVKAISKAHPGGFALIFLYCYMATVVIVLLLAAAMEYEGLRSGVSGANGFVWTMLSGLMGVVLVPVSLAAWYFEDGRMAFATLVIGGGWLVLLVKLTMKLIISAGRRK